MLEGSSHAKLPNKITALPKVVFTKFWVMSSGFNAGAALIGRCHCHSFLTFMPHPYNYDLSLKPPHRVVLTQP
jgi:hypothetical protein